MGLDVEPRILPPARLTSELGRSAARAAVRSGAFISVRRGALVPAVGTADEWEADEALALAKIASVARKLSNDAAVSHTSAALLHGLWVSRVPSVPDVTQSTKQNTHAKATLRRHCSPLPPTDVTTIDDVRVTSLARTIADCAKTMHPRDAFALVDSGMRALLNTDRFSRERDVHRVTELRAQLLAVAERNPPRGKRRARAVISAADPYSESPPESSLRWIVVSRGLSAPTTQLAVHTRGGVFFADLGWRWVVRGADGTPETHVLLLEYDGEVKYLPDGGLVGTASDSAHAVLREKWREDLIRENRHTTILRFVSRDLRDPDATFARILAAVPPAVRPHLEPVPDLLASSTFSAR